MSVGSVLAGLLSLCLQDPGARLFEAVRNADSGEAREALAALGRADGARAGRAIAAALPRARERTADLLRATVSARRAYDDIDDSVDFSLRGDLKERALELAAACVREACARALEGERVYEAIQGAGLILDPSSARTLAEELDRTSSWILKCELIGVLASMGVREPLERLLEREKEPVVVAAALEGIESLAGAAYLDHPHWQVRLAALSALRRSPEAAGTLVGRLRAADYRWRTRACAVLSEITGANLPPDPAVWKDWWKANGGDFEAGTYEASRPLAVEGPGRTTFYEIPIDSSRVCFLIDRSISMSEQGRLDAAKKELKRNLDLLPDGARFNIVFFGGWQKCFSRTPRTLDAATRREAARFVDRMGYASCTDVYGALEKALAFTGNADTGRLHEDGLDTFVLLSDGKATVGKVIDDDLVARVFARRARYLRPVVHVVSLGAESRSLRLLAERTGGEYRNQ